jgi:hypothetical protein
MHSCCCLLTILEAGPMDGLHSGDAGIIEWRLTKPTPQRRNARPCLSALRFFGRSECPRRTYGPCPRHGRNLSTSRSKIDEYPRYNWLSHIDYTISQVAVLAIGGPAGTPPRSFSGHKRIRYTNRSATESLEFSRNPVDYMGGVHLTVVQSTSLLDLDLARVRDRPDRGALVR